MLLKRQGGHTIALKSKKSYGDISRNGFLYKLTMIWISNFEYYMDYMILNYLTKLD